jgi:uncharacterized membrane protein
MSEHKKTFAADFKRFFGRGLAILLPSMLTLWILWHVFAFVFANVAEPINRGIRGAVIWVVPMLPDEQLPSWYRIDAEEIQAFRRTEDGRAFKDATDDQTRAALVRRRLNQAWRAHWYLRGLGIVVAITLIYLAGMLLGGLIGRRMYSRLEKLISRIPGFKQVYPHVKQAVDLVLGDRPQAFRRVVLVEYPRKGIWTVGMVTGESMASLQDRAGNDCLCVFIPSTPTPFTGFTINVRREEAVDLPISIDEAIRYFITGGVLIPDRESSGGKPLPAPDRADKDQTG